MICDVSALQRKILRVVAIPAQIGYTTFGRADGRWAVFEGCSVSRFRLCFFVTPKSYTRIDLLLFPFAMRESCDKIGVLFGAFALGGETAKRGSKER